MIAYMMGTVIRVTFTADDAERCYIAAGMDANTARGRGIAGRYDLASGDYAVTDERIPPSRPGCPSLVEKRMLLAASIARAQAAVAATQQQDAPVTPARQDTPTLTTRNERPRRRS
jgi:hypothetical protein